MFYLTTHSTHFIYGYMASDIWLRTILIVRMETRCRHIGYSYRLTARVLLYAPSHRQDNTYHGLCYTSRGALAGTRNSSMGPWRIDPTTHRTMNDTINKTELEVFLSNEIHHLFYIHITFVSVRMQWNKWPKTHRLSTHIYIFVLFHLAFLASLSI